MAALFRRPYLDPRIVPTLGQLELDPTHPLAFSEGWVPGSQRGFTPLVGPGGTLIPVTGIIQGKERGPGFTTSALTAHATGPVVGAALQPSAGVSVVWVGTPLGVPGGTTQDASYFGQYYNAAEAVPYYNFVLKSNNSSSPYGISFESNSGGTRASLISSSVAPTTTSVIVATAEFYGGPISLYINGVVVASATWGAGGGPSYSGPPVFSFSDPYYNTDRYPNVINLGGFFYNRALSAEEVARITAEPFGMLEYASRRTFVSVPAAPALIPGFDPGRQSRNFWLSAPEAEVQRTARVGAVLAPTPLVVPSFDPGQQARNWQASFVEPWTAPRTARIGAGSQPAPLAPIFGLDPGRQARNWRQFEPAQQVRQTVRVGIGLAPAPVSVRVSASFTEMVLSSIVPGIDSGRQARNWRQFELAPQVRQTARIGLVVAPTPPAFVPSIDPGRQARNWQASFVTPWEAYRAVRVGVGLPPPVPAHVYGTDPGRQARNWHRFTAPEWPQRTVRVGIGLAPAHPVPPFDPGRQSRLFQRFAASDQHGLRRYSTPATVAPVSASFVLVTMIG